MFKIPCALVLALQVTASADKLRVPEDFETIQAAIDAAGETDVIQVSKGTYAGFTVSGKTGLTITGKGKPVVDGAGAGVPIAVIEDCSGITLKGLIFRDSVDRGVLITGSTGITIQKCTISDTTLDGIRAWASSALLVEKCTIEDTGDGVDLSAEGKEGPATDSTIRKNTFEGNVNALDIGGSGHLIEKNSISGSLDEAISLDDGASGIMILKNKLEDVDSAIVLRGTGHTVEKNTAKRVNDEGIQVKASDCRIEKNKLDDVVDDGIDVEGDDNLILSNNIKKAGMGIEVEDEPDVPGTATGNLFEKNKVSGSGTSGFCVNAAGNTFRANKASKSGTFGLVDMAGAGANTYEDNKFGTEFFDM